MGNSVSEEEFKKFTLPYTSLTPISPIKNGFGNLVIMKDKKKNLYIEKQIFYDSQESLFKIRKALLTIQGSRKINYLRAYSVSHNSQKFFCTVSNIKIIFDFFEDTLEDILRKKERYERKQGFDMSNLGNFEEKNNFDSDNNRNFVKKNNGRDFNNNFRNKTDITHDNKKFLKNELNFEFKEYRIWRLIFSICKILRFNKLHKIENNFIHPKSIFYSKKSDNFGLIHSSYFKTNNFILAISQKSHFSSPELFCQILSKDRTFVLQNENKSNIFSLGLIILKTLTNYKNAEIFDINLLQINIQKLHKICENLQKKKFSRLLIRVINDMIQELEHIRITPTKFLKILENFEKNLEEEGFKGYEEVLKRYIGMKAKQDDLSLEFKLEEIYADPEKGEKTHYLQTNLEPGFFNTLNQKTVPFEYNFMDGDARF